MAMMAKAAKVAMPWDDLPVAYCVLICMTILNPRVDLAIRNGHLNINSDDGCFKSLLI